MTRNHDKLPPLTALRAFEAAARLMSFTRAAQDLHVTQGAISRQVLALEEYMGCALFTRSGKTVVLTGAGEDLANTATQCFDDIRLAVARARQRAQASRNRSDNVVTVSMLASIAAKWFTPRLSQLLSEVPNLDLRICASRALVDFERDGVDCGLRYGLGDWPQVDTVLLMRETVFPAASPTLVKRLGLKSLLDLQKAVLLQTDNPDDWTSWLRRSGAKSKLPRNFAATGPFFTDDVSLIQAAVDGLGVALVRSRLVERELKEGVLVRLGSVELDASWAYYLVTPKGHAHTSAVKRFVQWLVAAA